MTTSIMVCTYNRLQFTQRSFNSLFENTTTPFRLFIVDNGSADGTIEWLKQLKPQNDFCQELRIHFNETNLGIAIGRNQGLLLAKDNGGNDPYLCTIDNDIEFPSDWLKNCTDIIADNPRMSVGINFENTTYPLITRNNKTFQLKPKGNLGTACAAFHRSLPNKIGYFNTEYAKYSVEDSDYFFRARLAGWECAYLPEKGNHFAEEENDYVKWKAKCHKDTLTHFRQNCHAYALGTKSMILPPNCTI
jgi:GT2 family glycosyltransferase